ncbi:MAG: hypothetical protein B0W54_20600 [Cellvibrio sp. 79]|nr:MAG: hypothetical protein B0W54_20600 [Cellvibrio sp. 79]
MLSFTTWAASPAPANLDDELGRVISTTYNSFAKSATNANLADVRRQTEKAYQAKDYAGALQILANNNVLNAAYLNDPEIQPLVRLALQVYGHALVEQLLLEAQQQANTIAEARLTFELARFYAANEHWPKVTTLLSDISLFEQLVADDRTEAYVLQGTALQKQKKHREALRIYEKISANSKHFRVAQLNLASANLRQEWWTDAHAAINTALKENKNKRDALDYRLFTMLGYSQIQFGFYRDARESFRNVAISSEYAQRALLGLGVAALHQQDFIGALNAFDKLRAQPQRDISVAEAYLLSAFTLRQLEQFDAATGRYEEAIDYYQKLSSDIAAQANNSTSIHFLRPDHSNDKLLRNNAIKIALLDGLSPTPQITNLKSKFNTESGQRVSEFLREEKNAIDSYLSQSRFGLASLYDHK